MPKAYLVTGGCGFIGSHLVDALRARGDRVRVLDDLSTGHRRNLAPDTELVVGDVADAAVVAGAAAGMDGCFHLAAIASVQRSTEAWLETHRVNLGGTINVLQAARRPAGAAMPVVYASSAAVYGDNPALPLAESAGIAPLTPYGADKAGSELHARAAAATFGIPSVGLRFFNVFGPRQDPASPYSGVISVFAARIAAGQEITVFGDGRQTRDFVYVGDVVRALVAAMARQDGTARIVNVCTGIESSLLDLIAAVERVTGRAARKRHAAPRTGDIRRSLGDPARLAAVLGVRATTGLEDGLRQWLAGPRHAEAAAGRGVA